jgi:soluble lytic murein transglycosylase-like protein
MLRFAHYLFGFLLWSALSLPCLAGEIVHLTSGFEIEAISHTADANRYVLQMPTGGSLELPASEVLKVEIVPDRAGPKPDPANTEPGQFASIEKAIRTAADSQGLPVEFVNSVARMESGYNPKAVSPKGAIGLMQLMPSTAETLGVKPDVISDNAAGGAKYLRELLVRYKGNAVLALAAYNAGPDAVQKYGGVPPYSETRQYVLRVLHEYARQQAAKTTRTADIR